MPSIKPAKSKLYILTGETGSGKTTFISKWLKEKPDFGGIITITKNEKRVLLNYSTGEERLFEVDSSFTGTVQKIGRYVFDEAAFKWAEDIINKADFSKVECFVLDEAGILELGKKGFYKAILILLNKSKEFNTDIILVVRKSLVENMIEFFDLKNVKIYTKEEFKY